jgi:hypothetical protein
MDAFTFLVEMTKALAWPAVTLTVAAYARKPVGILLEGLRLQRLKGAGWEAEFSRKWDEEARHVVAELPAARKPPLEGFRFLETFGQGAQARDDATPLAAVIAGAWATVENRVREAASAALGPREGVPFGKILQELVQAGKVSPGTAEGLRGLEQLRNLAVHAPPRDEALAKRVPEFTAMAEAMLWSFEHDVNRELPTEIRSAKP